VVLVTDLQAAGLPAVRPPDWPENLPVRIVAVPPAGEGNAGIAAVRCLTPYPKKDALIRVRVAVCGRLPVDTAELVLDFDRGKTLRRTISLADAEVDFRIPGAPGLCRGTARLEVPDDYPADNRRPFAFFLRRPAPVLLIDGDPGKTPFAGETYFLAKALETARTDEGRSAYAVTVATVLPADLSRYAAVALCNVASFASDRVRSLAEFVRAGGGLVVFLGDLCEPDAYERLRRRGGFPLRFTPKRVAVPSPWLRWNARHPALAAFTGPDTGNLSRVVFRDAFDVTLDSGAEALAWLAGDVPALAVSRGGKGRVVILTNPCTREWTDWPAERIFLPLVRELFRYAVTRRGERVRPIIEQPPEPGVSAPEFGIREEKDRIVVTAPAAAEIDVTPCTEAAFRRALALPPAPESAAAGPATAGLPPGRERKNELWRWLAVALLGVLLLENVVADRSRPG
jgi:hypothetical protein